MSYEREYCEAALETVWPWLYLLPTDVQRKVRLAQSVLDSYGSACWDIPFGYMPFWRKAEDRCA